MTSRRRFTAAIATVSFLTIGALAGAQDLSWHTVDGGGGTCTDGVFEMSGTTGQHDAGTSSGGSFELTGGFWGGVRGDASPPCTGDIDGSVDVGFGDLLAVLSNWGPCPGCPEDLDGSDAVDFGDLLTVLSNWGPCPE